MNGKAPSEKTPAVILFGKDQTSKPHASYFLEADLAAALKAAELMKMRVLLTDSDERRAVAAALPQGRIFQASGRAFVPFVSAGVYRRLVALAGASVSGVGAAGSRNGPEHARQADLPQFSGTLAAMPSQPLRRPPIWFGRRGPSGYRLPLKMNHRPRLV